MLLNIVYTAFVPPETRGYSVACFVAVNGYESALSTSQTLSVCVRRGIPLGKTKILSKNL